MINNVVNQFILLFISTADTQTQSTRTHTAKHRPMHQRPSQINKIIIHILVLPLVTVIQSKIEGSHNWANDEEPSAPIPMRRYGHHTTITAATSNKFTSTSTNEKAAEVRGRIEISTDADIDTTK